MKTTNTLKGAMLACTILFCATQVNAQAPAQERNEGVNSIQSKSTAVQEINLKSEMQEVIVALQNLSNQRKEGLVEIIASLQSLSTSVNSQTGEAHFQNLSSTRSESLEGTYRSESVTGSYGKTEMQNLSNNRNESLEGTNRKESVEGVNGKTEMQNLSNSRNESLEGTYRKESVEGVNAKTNLQNLSNTSLQKLSSQEVVANLNGIITSLEGMNDATLNATISNLKGITSNYKGSSYNSLKNSITK